MTYKQPLIHFNFLIKPFYFPNRNKLKTFLTNRINSEGNQLNTINYIFCDDTYLLDINRRYLNHDTYTDIITFQLSEKNSPILSDIYISYERVKENAKQYQVSIQKELHRVIFHGCLHLCGYKDKSKADSKLMRQKENEYIDQYFVSRGTTSNKL